MPRDPGQWAMFAFFCVGSMGGLIYLARLMFWGDRRVEVHHRYHQVPVYRGPGPRAGDMAQDDPEDRPAA